jgi:phage gp45-like
MSFADEVIGTAGKVASRLVQFAVLSGDGRADGFDQIVLRGTKLLARRLLPWGFWSVPLDGSNVLCVGVNAGRSNKAYLAAQVPSGSGLGQIPSDLAAGEVALYNKVSGTLVKLDGSGNVVILPGPGAKVQLGDSTAANLDAVVLVTALESKVNAFIDKYNSHNHPTAPMGPVSVPSAIATHISGTGSSNVVAKK